MGVLRAVALLSCLHRFASADDAFCMVQKGSQVSQVALQPREVADGFSSAVRDVPGLAQFFTNFTIKDMKATNKDLILALKNKKYVGSMYMGLKNWTMSLGDFSGRLIKESQKLMGEAANATQKRAFFLLEHYTLVMDDIVAELGAGTFAVVLQLLEDAPPGAWRNATEQARQALRTQTRQNVSNLISGSILRPKTKRIFDQRSAFCTRFMLDMSKNVEIDNKIAAVVPSLKEWKADLPKLRSAVKEIAPGSQGEVVALLNTTLDATSRLFGQVNLAYHMMTKVMIEIASSKLNCTMPKNNTQVLSVARQVDTGKCMPLSDPSMAACSGNVETAMKAPESGVYGTMLQVVGVAAHEGTADDFARFHFCNSDQSQAFSACNKAPCGCSKPPCDVCLNKVGSAVSDLARSSAPAQRALVGLALAVGAWLAI